MSNEVTVYEEKPLTGADIRAQVNVIQDVMKAVMQQGQHFGVAPGCGNKPTLLKPGAEKIMATFRLAADPEADDLSFNDVIRYRVKCRMVSSSGRVMGAGLGECSSEEDKYKWRGAVCDAEFDATPETHKRVKFNRDGKGIKQVRTNPYDLANTILKMAKKRALVDGVLTVTAASDIFTQDLEELPPEYLDKGAGKPPLKEPQTKSADPASGDATKPQCPICQGDMWDNREKKTNPKQPDYKCKDKECKGLFWPGQWPPKNESDPTDSAHVNVPEDCTGDAATCDHSTYIKGNAKCVAMGKADCLHFVKEPI